MEFTEDELSTILIALKRMCSTCFSTSCGKYSCSYKELIQKIEG